MEIVGNMKIGMRFGFWVLLFCTLGVRPASAGVEDSFDYFVNNWNVVGLPDYMYGSRITPDNEMYLAGGTALRVRVGGALTPLSRAQGKRARNGWMPVIEVTAADGPVRYEITYWATPLPNARDWQKAFSWPTEGENYLNWITVRATNTSATAAEAKAEVAPDPAAHPDPLTPVQHPRKHTRVYAWTWKLAAGQSAEGVARYTFFPIVNAAQYDHADAGVWLERTVQYWHGMMSRPPGSRCLAARRPRRYWPLTFASSSRAIWANRTAARASTTSSTFATAPIR